MKKVMFIVFALILVMLMGCTQVQKTTQLKNPDKPKVASVTLMPISTPLRTPQAETQQEEAQQKIDAVSNTTDPAEQEQDVSGDVVVIKDKMFIAQCNDIYLNPDDYKDKTIVLEGMYGEAVDPATDLPYSTVYRNGPGCCGNDGIAGFEIRFAGQQPKLNDWVRVAGKLKRIEENSSYYYVLELSELTVLTERGAEFVSN